MTAEPESRAQTTAPAEPEPAPEPASGPDSSPAPAAAGAREGKAPHALRTISEAAQELDLPQHVLRFWETRFPGLKPLKRAGGRRYYRPEDMDLLRRIRGLLHGKGYTIKGAQKLLADETPAAASASVSAPAPAVSAPEAAHLRREAAALLDELKDVRAALKADT